MSTFEEMVSIPKWQMKRIEDTLRMTNNIHKAQKQITCFDRSVCQAWDFAKNALKTNQLNDIEKTKLKSDELKSIKDSLDLFSNLIEKIQNRDRPEFQELLYKQHDKLYLELEVVSPLLTIVLLEWYATKDDVNPKIPFGCKLLNIETEQNLRTVINKILDDITGFDKFKEEFEK